MKKTGNMTIAEYLSYRGKKGAEGLKNKFKSKEEMSEYFIKLVGMRKDRIK